MPYVERRGGQICGCYANKQPGYAEELLTDDHPEVLAFLVPKPPIDFSDVENVEKALKALGMVAAAWNGKTRQQLRDAFKQAWDSLP